MNIVTVDAQTCSRSSSCIEHPIVASAGDSANLAQRIAEVVTQHQATIAIATATSEFSYAQIFSAAETVARTLLALPEFSAGARVILIAPNSAEYIIGMLGIWLADGVMVPLSLRTEAEVLRNIAQSVEAVAVMTTTNAERNQLKEVWDDVQRFDASSMPSNASPDLTVSGTAHPAACTADSLAAILFTSGSSGAPKGVMLTHGNLYSNATAIQQYLEINTLDRPLCVLPFQHAFGNSVLQSHLLAGATLILDGMPAFPETLLDAIDRHSCTSLSGVPDLFNALLERSSLEQRKLPTLRYMSVAGGALRRELALEVQRRIRPAEFFVMYGQTEATARLAFVPPNELSVVAEGCAGRAIPGVTLSIVDDAGNEVPPGITGELRARGPSIMAGYWRDPEATAKRVRDGWLHTGDLGVIDQQGRLTINGRKSSFIKIAGYRVQPGELEAYAERTFDIHQAVAVPFELASVGTRLALFVRPRGTSGEFDISGCIADCRAKLPRHLVPAAIQVVDKYPVTHASKIDRPLLSRWAQENAKQRRRPA